MEQQSNKSTFTTSRRAKDGIQRKFNRCGRSLPIRAEQNTNSKTHLGPARYRSEDVSLQAYLVHNISRRTLI